MSDCPACSAALYSPFTGEYANSCPGCQIRAVSNAPRRIRDAYYSQIADKDERDRFKSEVLAEFGRRNALKAKMVEPVTVADAPEACHLQTVSRITCGPEK